MKLSKTILAAGVAAVMTIGVAGALRAATCNYSTIYNTIAGGDWVDGSGCNFFAKDFSNLTFTWYSNFIGTNLNLAGLHHATLDRVYFLDAEMLGAQLNDSSIKRTRFGRANLSLSNLKYTQAEGADFYDANLERANLTGMFAWNSTSQPSGTQKIRFRFANLRYADLRNSSLAWADMLYTTMTYAKLDGADLRHAHIGGTGQRISAVGTLFRNADLSFMDLRHGNFTNADLRNTDLQSVKFQFANFTGANLSGAFLVNANLEGATWTDGVIICKAGSIGFCKFW